MKISINIIHLIILITFIYSKVYYFSIFSVGSLNFTLSDFCLLIMIILILKSSQKVKPIYINLFIISIILLLTFSIGSLINGTSIINGLIIYIKRWLSLLIIPIYILKYIKKENIPFLVFSMFLIILLFAFDNWNDLSNIDQTRFTETFNPNILGMLMAMIFIFFLNYKSVRMPSFIKWVIYFICFTFIVAVSSRGALLALIPTICINIIFAYKKITYKIIFLTISFIVFILLFIGNILEILKNIFPYSFARLSSTLLDGILNDRSASSRLETQFEIIKIFLRNLELLLFGTGFGNNNMFLALNNYGFQIYTSDNMYVNILAWSGAIGFILFIYMCYLLIKNSYFQKSNMLRPCILLLTIYILLGGLTLDTLTEPTIGAFYFIFYGFFEIYRERG